MKQELIHVKEAAKLLGVTRQAVYKKLQVLGKKPQKVGNKAFIDAATLREIKDGKKLQPPSATGDTSATKQVDNELVNLLKKMNEELKLDKVAAQRQVDNLQRQLEIKDRQIDDLSTGGREMRLLLGSAQKQIGLLTAPINVDEPFPPDHNQPEKPAKKKKKKKKKKR